MTITLCIETSGSHCSLALAGGENLYTADRLLDRNHNLQLLKLLDELFVQADIAPLDVELVAFGCGPGSFTGVRIAAAASQAIALAASAPVVTVPSLLAMALTASRRFQQRERFVCCQKSRGQAYYLATFERIGAFTAALEQRHGTDLADAAPQWLEEYVDDELCVAVGGRPPWFPDDLTTAWVEDVYPCAADFLNWARTEHEAGKSVSPEQALPTYVAGDSPWKKSA